LALEWLDDAAPAGGVGDGAVDHHGRRAGGGWAMGALVSAGSEGGPELWGQRLGCSQAARWPPAVDLVAGEEVVAGQLAVEGSRQDLGDQAGLAGPIPVVQHEGGQLERGVGQPVQVWGPVAMMSA
jgi:hypothetical protein